MAIKELSRGLSNGTIKRKFHIVEGGIEQAPIALPMLFSGGNTGKLCVFDSTRLFLLSLCLSPHEFCSVVKVSEEPKAKAKLW